MNTNRDTEGAVPADIEEYVKYVTKVPPMEEKPSSRELDKKSRIAARDAVIKAKSMASKFEKIQAIMDDEDNVNLCVFNDQSTRATTILAPFGLDLTNPSPGLPTRAGSLAYGYDTGSLYYADDDLWYKLLTGGDIPPLVVGAFDNDEDPKGLYVAETGALRMSAASATAPGGVSLIEQQFSGLKDFGLEGIRLKANPSSVDVITRLRYYAKWTGLMTFTGGIGSENINGVVTVERIGDTISLGLPLIYAGLQTAAFITTTTALPLEFRPAFDSGSLPLFVINGSRAGASASNAIDNGLIQLLATGFFNIGLGFDNTETIVPFGGAGVSGSGNGVCRQIITIILT